MIESYVTMQTAIRAIPILSQKQQEIIQEIIDISRKNLYCDLTNAELAEKHYCSVRYVSATIKKAIWLGFLMNRDDLLFKVNGKFNQIRRITFEIPEVWYGVGMIYEYAKGGNKEAKEFYDELREKIKEAYKSNTKNSIIKLLEEWGVWNKCSILDGTKVQRKYIYNIYSINSNIIDTDSIYNKANNTNKYIEQYKDLSNDKSYVAYAEDSSESSAMQRRKPFNEFILYGETDTSPELVACSNRNNTDHNSFQENRSNMCINKDTFSSKTNSGSFSLQEKKPNKDISSNKNTFSSKGIFNDLDHNSLQEIGLNHKNVTKPALFGEQVLANVRKSVLTAHAPDSDVQSVFAFWNTLYNIQKHKPGSKVYAKAYVMINNLLCGRPVQVKRNGEPTQWLLDFVKRYNIDPSLIRKRWTKEEIYTVLEAVVSEVPDGTKLSLASTLFNNYGKSGPYSRFLVVADRLNSINKAKNEYINLFKAEFGDGAFYDQFMDSCFNPVVKLLTNKTISEENKLARNLVQMFRDIRAYQDKIPQDVRKILPSPMVMIARYVEWLGENSKWITDISAKIMDINCPLFTKFRAIEAKRHLDIDSLSGKYVH